ncbi:Glycosyl transferase family 1 [Salinibacillus kushneri]|uniref:Glycosyl transferase family 1 n=1 Tax=Salinibacillus kushneri TaxID=237682 RepID=A0A1H9ZEC6_9BACI|nr:glycosyltransferase family protein [Salinibacillus kushneri]SES80009.1 Glycosyl transferase family 1 [Salinibacillus kushneri]
MKTVAFYISDYGFGHASRSIAIIRELSQQYGEDLRMIICNSFAMDFLKESLTSYNVEFRKVNTDVGYVLQNNSMKPDANEINHQYQAFMNDWEETLRVEKGFLKQNHVDLVISDISPLPFIPAKELNIPSIGVSNFTWYTAYKD